jgi:ParB/RepB/Spo0J family partition protein
MTAEQLDTLARNIEHAGGYAPLVVRPHPAWAGEYQLLDGEQRLRALLGLGHHTALCFVWPCDDQTALLLLGTLNRLRGEDVPVRRAELLQELNALMPAEELALLLPEDASEIEELVSLLDLDAERLLADLATAHDRAGTGLRAITFAVSAEDETTIEAAITAAIAGLDGKNRRGRALATIAQAYQDGGAA